MWQDCSSRIMQLLEYMYLKTKTYITTYVLVDARKREVDRFSL